MFGKNLFKFGLETEFLLAHRDTFQPYWHREVSFERINTLFESIPLEGIRSLEELELEPPHRKKMPYVVEGYHRTDAEFRPIDILLKGVEIRTPVCDSIDECLEMHQMLYRRLQEKLATDQLVAVALSHHPTEDRFEGPQNKRRHDFWLWAMEVMTTYGPDINVGIPAEMMGALDQKDFLAKLNYYAASMTAFSVASPFLRGDLWKHQGKIGKSYRTYRRSVLAPPIEIHPHENNRLEFKVFDMSCRIQDYSNYFLLFLTVLLDSQLNGRATQANRIYDQGAVALHGWEAPEVQAKAKELLMAAERILPQWGFDLSSLASFEDRFRLQTTPADELIVLYQESNHQLAPVLKYLADLR